MIKNIILDTKVFVLFIIGMIDKNYINKFIRTKEFSVDEYETLLTRINSYENIFITPHILTEFSHFTFEEKTFRDDYKKFINKILVGMQSNKEIHEKQSNMLKIFSNNRIYYLGVADVGLMELCEDDCLVITSDGVLADKIREEGKNALKFIPTAGFVEY